MKKVELEITTLIATQSFFHLILKEKNGSRRLPIVIGAFEGRVITWTIENIIPVRPLTHDLLVNIIDAFGIELQEIIINKFENNIFHAELVLLRSGSTIRIDSRASDAIAIALKKNAPIYTTEEVMKVAAVDLEDFEEYKRSKNTLENKTLEELEEMLNEAVETENYEFASKIRDEIKRRKQQNSKSKDNEFEN